MFNCKKKKPAPVVNHIDNELDTIGIVIGHNKKSQGAVNYLGESEYIFNKRIANKIQAKLGTKNSIILERPLGSYTFQSQYIAKKVKELGIKKTLNLHFNAAASKARGQECLVHYRFKNHSSAIMIVDAIHEMLGITKRHNDGIKEVYKGHRGYKMLDELYKVGCLGIIVEPCFAHYRNPDSVKIFESEDRYVEALVCAIA